MSPQFKYHISRKCFKNENMYQVQETRFNDPTNFKAETSNTQITSSIGRFVSRECTNQLRQQRFESRIWLLRFSIHVDDSAASAGFWLTRVMPINEGKNRLLLFDAIELSPSLIHQRVDKFRRAQRFPCESSRSNVRADDSRIPVSNHEDSTLGYVGRITAVSMKKE